MANTLNLGNGNWATKEDSLLAYNSENGNYKPLPFDFTRASSATVVNKAGLIETVGSGEPRIDFKDDAKGALLLEPTRSNLITYSEDFNQWTNISYTLVESNSTTSPDGSVNADKLVAGATNGLQLRIASLSLISGFTYTFSTYVKNYGGNYVILYMNDSTSQGIKVDLVNETFVTMGSATNHFIKNFGNGWYQIGFTRTIDANVSGLNAVPSLDGNNVSFLGDGVNGVYLWGAQAEQGSYATSYIPTSGQSGGVTRGEDDISLTLPDNTSFNSSVGFTLYGEFLTNGGSGTSSMAVQVNSNLGYFGFGSNSSNWRARLNNGTDNELHNSTSSILSVGKLALSFNSSGFSMYANGTSFASGNTNMGAITSADSIIYRDTDEFGSFKIRDLKLYNTRLTDQELQALTKI